MKSGDGLLDHYTSHPSWEVVNAEVKIDETEFEVRKGETYDNVHVTFFIPTVD